MRPLRAWFLRLAGVFGRERRDDELSAELAAHLQLHIDDNLRAGLTTSEARRLALLRLGGLQQVRERYEDLRGLPGLDHLIRDVGYTIRTLARQPGFTAVAILTLALGIGVNSALFTLVNAALFRPLPVERPDELVDVYTSRIGGDPDGPNSYPDYLDLRQASADLFSGSFGYTPAMSAVAAGERARLLLGEVVTGDYFRTLGVRPSLGRGLELEDDRPGADRAVVVSHAFWQRELAGSPHVLGTTIRIQSDPYTIVGVAPATFRGMVPILDPQFWKAMTWLKDGEQMGISETVPSPGGHRLQQRGARWMFIRARLKPGQTVERAGSLAQATMARLAQEHPDSNGGRRTSVIRTSDVRILPGPDTFIWLGGVGLMAAGGLILLVVCANVSGLLLVRAAGRQREFTLRVALGASRWRLAQQVLIESLVMSAAGAAAGAWMAWLFARGAEPVSGPLPFPVGVELTIDARVLGFTAAAATVAALASALLPAWRATRPTLADSLKGAGVTDPIARRRWTVSDGLAILQVGVTIVFLVTAALLGRGLLAARQADPGFRIEGLVAVNPVLSGYDNQRTRDFFKRALPRVRSLAGVESAALAGRLPMAVNWSDPPILIPGVHSEQDKAVATETTVVSADYFRTLGIPLIEGRDFAESDSLDSPKVAIVSATMAKRYWPGEGAIGRRFRMLTWDGPEYQVIGVSADYKVRTIGEAPTPYIHFAASQGSSPPGIIVVRTRGDEATLTAAVRRELLAMEPDLVLTEAGTVSEQTKALLVPVQGAAAVLAASASVAMLLALIGLYGVVANAAARRRHEIGVRLALGARPDQIRRMVLGRGLLIACAGVIAGTLPAIGVARLAASVVYGVAPADPLAWGLGVALVLVLACLANDVPARRASRMNPTTALRVD